MPILCEIVTWQRVVFSGAGEIVMIPSVEGEMGILPQHAPLLSMLKPGIVTVRTQKTSHHFVVSDGIIEVQPDQVTILADDASNCLDLVFEDLILTKNKLEAMKNAEGISNYTNEHLNKSINYCNVQLSAIQKYQTKKG